MDIKIRNIKFIDIFDIAKSEKNNFAAGEARSYSDLCVLYFTSPHNYLAYTDDNIIVGYIFTYVDNIESGMIGVAIIAVNDGYRKYGIGHKLLSHCIEQIKKDNKYCKIELCVRFSNDVAIRLYSKNGFGIVNSLINYYSNPTENALNMVMNIER